jgi:hypothetical protein
MTAEESGLWHAMWEELQVVSAAIARLEGGAASKEEASPRCG